MSIWEKVKKYANGLRILTDMLGPDGQVVTGELAQQRANTCLKCPKNQRGGVVTKAVAWAIKEQMDLKNELELTVAGEENLKSCKICDCPLKTKIWFTIEKIRSEQTPEESAAWPSHCWIKNEP